MKELGKKDIEKIIKEVPQLTCFGINYSACHKDEKKRKKFKDDQQKLLESTDEFKKTCVWLEDVEKIKTINKKHTSYGLKHIAEKEIGYITNGVFIAAALHMGFEYKVVNHGPNVSFAMSEKSIKRKVNI